jgi:23S rRNA (pseudouridine1915-N3)-methyltransferase
MKIRVIAVGKIDRKLQEIQDYYKSRVKNLEIIEVKKGRTLHEEAERIEKFIKGFAVVLDEKGKQLTSKEFSKFLEKHPFITFVIGGAEGISEELKRKANFLLSLSKLTLQHDIARIVLLEQIFRGKEIIRGSPYHRE